MPEHVRPPQEYAARNDYLSALLYHFDMQYHYTPQCLEELGNYIVKDYLYSAHWSVREQVRAHISEAEILQWVFAQSDATWIKWLKVDQVIDADRGFTQSWSF